MTYTWQNADNQPLNPPLMKPLPELMSFLEGLPEPHILFDTQYRILSANAAYRRQFSPERSRAHLLRGLTPFQRAMRPIG